MPFAAPFTMFAAAALIAAGAAGSAAAQQTNGRYCLKDGNTRTMNCSYDTLAECNKFRRPTNANCVPNPNLAQAPANMAPRAAAAGNMKMSGSMGFCLQNPSRGTLNCSYDTMAACQKFARPETNSTCVARPARATTGAR